MSLDRDWIRRKWRLLQLENSF